VKREKIISGEILMRWVFKKAAFGLVEEFRHHFENPLSTMLNGYSTSIVPKTILIRIAGHLWYDVEKKSIRIDLEIPSH